MFLILVFTNQTLCGRKQIHNEIFDNIPLFIKKRLYVDCLHDDFLCTMVKNEFTKENSFLIFLII